MGYDVDRFVNFDIERNRELICAICLDVLQDAIQTQCDHLFCNYCFQQLLRESTECRCPSCNATVHRNNLSSIPRPLKNMINNLDIKCDYYEKGCGKIVKVENLNDHLKTCSYAPSSSGVGVGKRNQDAEAARGQDKAKSNRSQRPARRRPEERQQLLSQSRRAANSNGELMESMEVNCAPCCASLLPCLLLLGLIAAFIGMAVIGIYYVNGCQDYPILPRLLITIGISGSLTVFFACLKACCFEDHNCGILTVLPLVFVISHIILFIVVYFIIDIRTVDFKTWWLPEVHFNCDLSVVWWSVCLCNITLLIIAAIIAFSALVLIVTFVVKCCVFLF